MGVYTLKRGYKEVQMNLAGVFLDYIKVREESMGWGVRQTPSENTKKSWGAITEVGAAWITQVDHKIFNIPPFRPEHPLDDEAQWQTTNREEPTEGDLWMSPLSADIFCQKIESICDLLGYKKKSRVDNKNHLDTIVEIK